MKKRKSSIKWLFGSVVAFILLTICATIAIIQLFNAAKTTLPVPSSEQQLREEFIGEIGEVAREVADEHDLYASVMIAQASLESHFGTSGLGSEPNYNLYGIKGNYDGHSVKMKTQEDDGEGNLSTIKADFRKYTSYRASMEDYADLLASGTSWDKNMYAAAFKTNAATYKDATAALTGSYATDSRYHEKLNALIEQYDLTAYDTAATKKTVQTKFFDNVEDIAAEYNISSTLIRQWNHLTTNELKKDNQIILYINH